MISDEQCQGGLSIEATQTVTKTTTEKTVETQTTAAAESPDEQINGTQPEEQKTAVYNTDEELVRTFYASQNNGNYGSFNVSYIAIDENGNEVDYKDEVNLIIHRAEILPGNRELGRITDEQDAINKGRELLLNLRGQEYIDRQEREYIDYEGHERIYRDNPFYVANYYEDFDIWFFCPTLFSSRTESGVSVDTPGTVPYFYIRGCDGKVLATFD